MNKETIVIDGMRYYADRPRNCRGCFFWKNRKVGCTLKKENCYYLAESPKKKSPCVGCCYGPCVSFCKGKNIWKDAKTQVLNTELKAMVEAYKAITSQEKAAQPRESAMEKLDALVKDTAAKVSLYKPKKSKTKAKGPEL